MRGRAPDSPNSRTTPKEPGDGQYAQSRPVITQTSRFQILGRPLLQSHEQRLQASPPPCPNRDIAPEPHLSEGTLD